MLFPGTIDGKPYESDLFVRLRNGSEIRLIGFDKPSRFEGIPWTGGIIDEIADVKESAWYENISPALDTEGLDTWCWLIGVPDGLNHFYDLAEYAQSGIDDEWSYYHWLSSEILSPAKIAAAKKRLSPAVFRQEYEASFETASGRVYADYSNDNHTDVVFRPGDIHWSHDFNYLPMSSIIFQVDGERDNVYAVDEIVLEHATAANVAVEFCERYKDHERCQVYLYGDASGRAGEKHGHVSDYLTIERILGQHGFTVRRMVPRKNPAIRDGQNSLRAKILNADGNRSFFVNPRKCKTLDKGLKTLQLKKGSAFQEEETKYQHITTAARYFTHIKYPAEKTRPTVHDLPI